MMRYHGAKGNLTNASKATEIEEKFDILVDANDQLLEKVVCGYFHFLTYDSMHSIFIRYYVNFVL